MNWSNMDIVKIINRSVIILVPLVLMGCTMSGVMNISNPYISALNQPLESGVLKLDSLSISIKPQTYKVGLLTIGPILPIIPTGSGNDYNR